ncbi:dihydrofolate reductase [Peribacillus sp. SCS-26]|uniref:dihydrofolate reductase n=1 Tax=Paraperibacillus marinus TaxID=3115295 RepID=UPI0039065A73
MISFIVAMDRERVIGRDNNLPWSIPADLRFFKETTMGHGIVMGRKTFESIGRALPGRKNIIMTRSGDFSAEGCSVIHSIEELKALEKETEEELFVIGGSEIFKLTLPIADRLYITYIDETFEGDTFFPAIDQNEWILVSNEKGPKDERNPYDYYFRVYDKKGPKQEDL